MGSFSLWHWLIVLLIVVLIFGTKKLKNIGADLGGAVNEFKKALNEGKSEEVTNKQDSTIEGEVTSKIKQ